MKKVSKTRQYISKKKPFKIAIDSLAKNAKKDQQSVRYYRHNLKKKVAVISEIWKKVNVLKLSEY